MPGYPAACLVNFYYYLLPTIKTMMGIGEALPRTRSVVLGQDLRGGRGRWDAIRVRLERRDGCERAFALDSQLTSHFLNYGACDGLVTLDDETVRVAAGQPVDLLEFRMQL
jgi:molybdopterin molybdotransferase